MPSGTLRVILVAAVATLAFATIANASSPPTVSDAVEIALDHVRANPDRLGLAAEDVDELVVTDAYGDAHNGVTHVYLRQAVGGVPVNDANMTVNVGRDGSVLSSPHHFVAGVDGAAAGQVELGAVASAGAAAEELGLRLTEPIRVLEGSAGPADELVLSDGGVAERPIPARLVYQRLDDGRVRLAWHLEIEEAAGEHFWSAAVDATTGELLVREDYVIEDDVAATAAALARPAASASSASITRPPSTVSDGSSYRVYPIPLESPLDGDRSLVTEPADGDASPFGWHDVDGAPGAEFTRTQGNNVHAYTDRVPPGNTPDPGSDPDGGPGLDFDFPIDLTLDPVDYSPAAVTNLFYWNNVIHDVLWRYGFNEQAGNYQVNNYGRGGAGNDWVRAEAQDSSGTNNANFSSGGADGGLPRMQMFLWTHSRPNVVVVDPPSAAAGSYEATSANFGPQLTLGGPVYSGAIAIGDDGAGASATDGCEPLVGFPAGSIAIMDRGTCNFTVKVKNAQDAGAIAAIVANNVPGNPITMGGTDPTVTIPSVMVSQEAGAVVKGGLPATGSIARDPARGTRRDGDLDAGIIAHEYGHGVSNRLTGGPNTPGCLSGQEQMGEGWSDWQGVTLTALPSDTGPGMRGVGGYALYQSGRYDQGIRPTAYSTDMSINPSTYDTIKTAAVPHGVGYVWNTMLWEMYWNLVEKYGFNPNVYDPWDTGGNNRAIQLVHDGMKFQVCDPGFVDGRDAILAADQALTGGEDQCLIWRGFVKRGLGYGAVQGTSASRGDGTQAFNPHPDCFFTGGKAKAAPGVATVEEGAAVPLVFSLVGDRGLDIFAAGSPSSRPIDCATKAPSGPSSPIETPGGSGLTYDASTDSYTYVWKTSKAWAGTCRELVIAFDEGYEYNAFFSFT